METQYLSGGLRPGTRPLAMKRHTRRQGRAKQNLSSFSQTHLSSIQTFPLSLELKLNPSNDSPASNLPTKKELPLMALLLLHSPYTTELHPTLMDVPDLRPKPHHLLSARNPTSLLASCNNFLSPRILCHHITLKNMSRFTFCVKKHDSLVRAPLKSTKQGQSTSTFTLKGSCEVVWTIEADLAAGQRLYITGDPSVLGCWEPDMAVLMYPTEHEHLWKAEVKIACGVSFKYNYFLRGEAHDSHDIIWRGGPEFSLLVPVKQNRKIVVRDSWIRFNTKKSPIYAWGSWIEETYLPVNPSISAPARDDEIVKHLESDSNGSKLFMNDITLEDQLYADDEVTVTAANDDSNSDTAFFERDQPVEEPWLLESSLVFLAYKNKIKPDMSNRDESAKDEVTVSDTNNQNYLITDNLLSQEGNLKSKEDPISTVILINSSICTMQRIAVLEDGKLVELLLEPVKSNVQCDSVYLGVVTKLVPHMGGAFVNIGNSRPSLMDIKQNREPFIFPPFRHRTKKGQVNGSVSGTLEEHPATSGDSHTSLNIKVIDDVAEANSQDDSVQFLHNEDEEPEIDDDFDVSEVLKNVNGSIHDFGEAEADFEDFLDGDHHLDGEAMNGPYPMKSKGSNDTEVSHTLDMKDSKQVSTKQNKWGQVQKGTKVIVQVVKEGLGTKGPTLTAYPRLRSRFWILITHCDRIGVSKKITGVERTRLKVIAKTLQPQGFGVTVRTVAAGHSLEELQKDLEGLLSTWKSIMEHAKSAALAADEGVEGAIPVILHRAMGQTLSVVQDYFNEKVKEMVVDSPRTYHEVTNYLQDIAPDLCDRVELYDKRIPLFDKFNIEEEIDNMLSKRVPLPNGGSLVIEQTEALVSIDVNGGHGMFGHETSKEKAILDVNLAAAKQIARELRLRDIGGIIVVDFIDMADDSNKRLVYEEVKKAVERDRSMVKVSELSRHGIMEITRKRVRPSVTFMISEPCTCCHGTGRVEALETSFSKIEQEICRLLATTQHKADPENPKSWPRFILRIDHHMCNYLTSGKRTKLAVLSSSLKVWLLLKVARGFSRGAFEVKPFTDDKSSESQHQVAISLLRPAEASTKKNSKKVTLVPIKKLKAGRK
ncbi:ribonuclease E/G-like protein, chloroplastic isoform X1 [Pistacia vera]|uniref:ribonuclease E/G-like protein, chloroplastic isoform X1 n=4 Tax=Pistacia vera TaxID=55513 RepID=UPI0012635D7C|nr:ribonuclease E/G-like protein, chloroplastic isoform X1 [Pistacia vera]